MLEALSYIQNVGRFDSFKGNAGTAFAPLTLIYSENGRGKTTLCAILRSLASGEPAPILERVRLSATSEPKVVAELEGHQVSFDGSTWTAVGPKILVFDEHFVDSNVYSGLSVDASHRKAVHELVVGEAGVRFQRRVLELTDEISTLQTDLRSNERAIPATVLGSFSVDDFCALDPIERIEEELVAAERSLSVLRDAEAIRETAEFRAFALPVVTVDAYAAVLAASLPDLEAGALAEINQHFSELGPGSERWVGEGIALQRDHASCPFCAQDASASPLIAHYRAYFSDAYRAHKRVISEAQDAVRSELSGDRLARMQRILQQEKDRRDFWARYTALPDFDLDPEEIARTWTSLRDQLLDVLAAKAEAPLEPIEMPPAAVSAASDYGALGARIRELSAALIDANLAIAETKEHAAEGSAAAAEARLSRLKASQKRFQPETDALCTAYLEAKAKKATAEAAKEKAREALDEHREKVFGGYQAAINRFLDTFNADFALERLKPSDAKGVPSATYEVRVNERSVRLTPPADPRPSFRTVLSTGDRSTLALAFFFASLEHTDLTDAVVVIDDPTSSLDDARAFATAQEIRRLFGRVRQLIVLSHSRSLLCQLWERADKDNTATLQIAWSGPDKSTIEGWDAQTAAATEYDRLHRLLSDYAEGSTGDPQKVAPALRLTLESFLRVAFIRHFKPGFQLKDLLSRAKQALAEGKPILSDEAITELDDLREYANHFHHSTNQKGWLEALANINEGQLRGYAKRVIRFATLDGRY